VRVAARWLKVCIDTLHDCSMRARRKFDPGGWGMGARRSSTSLQLRRGRRSTIRSSNGALPGTSGANVSGSGSCKRARQRAAAALTASAV